MKKTTKNIVSASVAAVMMGGANLAHAADSVNVAFFPRMGNTKPDR
jgi:hypothetical protein